MDEILDEMTLREYQAALASSSPTPGGGTAAAVALGHSAALTCMVCDLTIGKEKWETGWEDAENAQQVAIPLFNISLELALEDSKSFDAVMEAYRLPKDSEEAVMLRRSQIRLATLEAARTPLKTAEKALELMRALPNLALTGNANAVSDVGVSSLLANAACEGALMNVTINLSSLPEDMGAEERISCVKIREEIGKLFRATIDAVNARL